MKMFTQIDSLSLADHCYLQKDDECYFFGDFTPRVGFDYSETNQFILNFKKSLDRKQNVFEWQHKEKSIIRASGLIAFGFDHDWLKQATLIPCPPSKLKSDPLYDDRLLRTLKGVQIGLSLDIRELVIQSKPRQSMHLISGTRYTPEELMDTWEINESLANPEPRLIGVFDDVLTNGTHYRAMKTMLTRRYPGCDVVGVFLARVVRPQVDINFLFDE